MEPTLKIIHCLLSAEPVYQTEHVGEFTRSAAPGRVIGSGRYETLRLLLTIYKTLSQTDAKIQYASRENNANWW